MKIITISIEDIIIWKMTENLQEYKIKFKIISEEQNYSFFDYNKSLLYISDSKGLLIYDIKNKANIISYFWDTDNYEFFVLKKNEKENIMTKIIIYFEKSKKFNILQIFDFGRKYNNNYINEEAGDEFWKNSINKIIDSFNYLSYDNNLYENNEIKLKLYLLNDEIKQESQNDNKIYTLEEKRKFVSDNLKNLKENRNIKEIFINYIKYIIKDNTNPDLLIKYLKFLKFNDTRLKETEIKIENYNNEIEHFKFCICKKKLHEELFFIIEKTEKEKLYMLLGEISILDIDKKEVIDNYFDSKKKEFENFVAFNQPISFENEDLYDFRNRAIVVYSLEAIINDRKYNLFKNMHYAIKKILEKGFLNIPIILKNKLYLTSILALICIPQRTIITDYNINLFSDITHDKSSNATEKKLINLGFKKDKKNNKFYNNIIDIPFNDINSYNFNNLKLYIDNPNIFEKYEIYKFNEIIRYFNNKFDKEKIINFLTEILCSKVFIEAFSFLYGNNIKYPFSANKENEKTKKAKKYLENYLDFIPLKMENAKL